MGGVFGEAGGDDVGVGQEVDVERRADGRIEDDLGAVAAGEGGDGGDVSGLDERVGRGLDDQAGDARALGGEKFFQTGQVGDVAVAQVVARRVGRELSQQRDAVEIEPAQLDPRGAAGAGLHGADGAEGGVEGVHAARGEQQVGVGDREGTAQHALDLGGGVTGEKFLRRGGRQLAEADEVVLGGAGGEEAADVLQVDLAEGVQRGGVGMGDTVDAVGNEGRGGGRAGATKIIGERGGHFGGRDQPEGFARELGAAGEVLAETLGVGVDDEARVTRGDVLRGLGPALLVADDIRHGRQAAGDGVRAAGNALTEGNGLEDRHEGCGGGKLAGAGDVATAVCVISRHTSWCRRPASWLEQWVGM